MPVAGMAYLDRPSPAGYFIFPDLSVRHEGKYRLSFNLFEELKESKDADVEPLSGNPEHPNHKLLRSSPMAPQAHVHFRLEVKSEPFDVFSAKKFPGLAESTPLSRVVAEQGCRVRIRRDVRMRRRENKPNRGLDEFDEDGAAFARAERFPVDDGYIQKPMPERASSVSNNSVDANNVPQPLERRMSIHDANSFHQPPYQCSGPPMHHSVPAQHSHLSFGGSTVPQYQTPSIPQSGATVAQQSTGYNPNNTTYQYQQQGHSRQLSGSSNLSYSGQGYPQPQYDAHSPYPENADYSRRPMPSQTSSYSGRDNAPPYPAIDTRLVSGAQNSYMQSPATNDGRSSTPTASQQLPPLKTIPPVTERKYEQPSTPGAISGPIMASPQNAYEQSHPSYMPWNTTSPTQPGTSTHTGKRPYGNVFDTGHINQPIQSGARPDSVGQDIIQVECDGSIVEPEEMGKLLTYRRADGTKQHKKIHSPIA